MTYPLDDPLNPSIWEEMYQISCAYTCATEGHVISFTTGTCGPLTPPPGTYTCDRCQQPVEIGGTN